MCVLVSEAGKITLMDQAERAGLQKEQIVPTVNLFWDMLVSESIGHKFALLVSYF